MQFFHLQTFKKNQTDHNTSSSRIDNFMLILYSGRTVMTRPLIMTSMHAHTRKFEERRYNIGTSAMQAVCHRAAICTDKTLFTLNIFTKNMQTLMCAQPAKKDIAQANGTRLGCAARFVHFYSVQIAVNHKEPIF